MISIAYNTPFVIIDESISLSRDQWTNSASRTVGQFVSVDPVLVDIQCSLHKEFHLNKIEILCHKVPQCYTCFHECHSHMFLLDSHRHLVVGVLTSLSLLQELLPWSLPVLMLIQDNRNHCTDIQQNSFP